MTITVNIAHSGSLPCLRIYQNQFKEQPAYLQFDPSLPSIELTASFSGEIGNAIPVEVCHRNILRFSISAHSLRDSIAALADDADLERMLLDVKNAYVRKWDDHNHVGTYPGIDEDFEAQIEQHLFESLRDGEAADAGEWIADTMSIEELIAFGSVSAYEDAYMAQADEEGIYIVGDIGDCIACFAAAKVQSCIDNGALDDTMLRVRNMLLEHDHDTYRYLTDEA